MDDFIKLYENFIIDKAEFVSKSLEELIKCQSTVQTIYENIQDISDVKLLKAHHVDFLNYSIMKLPQNYQKTESFRTWHLYWILHSMDILKITISPRNVDDVKDFFSACQSDEGGFSGNHGEIPTLETTYASICSLAIIAQLDFSVFNIIKLDELKRFIMSCKCQDGSFKNSIDGEVSIWGIYSAITISHLTNTLSNEMFVKTVEYIVSCQNFDGGFGRYKNMESQIIYSYLAFASLVLLNGQDNIDCKKLLRYITQRQMSYEGGFQSRTNTVVTSSNSFWTVATLELLKMKSNTFLSEIPVEIFDIKANLKYLLACSQNIFGGFVKTLNYFSHLDRTCYCLSSIAISQYISADGNMNQEMVNMCGSNLARINSAFNLTQKAYQNALKIFYSQNA